jgi:hypothetical protein
VPRRAAMINHRTQDCIRSPAGGKCLSFEGTPGYAGV